MASSSMVRIRIEPLSLHFSTVYGPSHLVLNFPLKSLYLESYSSAQSPSWNCFSYRELNKATKKDHFPLPFIDQVLDGLAGKKFFSFLDGFSRYNQIQISPEDQAKTIFTCPWGTFSYRILPFGLCNALTSFYRVVLSIFAELVHDSVEIYMDDFTPYGFSF